MKHQAKNLFAHIGTLLLILALCAGNISAQGFIKTYPVTGNVNAATVDLVAGGYCVNASDWSDAIHVVNQKLKTLKTDADGNQTSLQQLTLPGFHAANGILGCGYFGIADSVFTNTGLEPFSITRIGIDGSVVFLDTLEGLPGNYHFPQSLCESADGNMVLSFFTYIGPTAECFLIKKSPAGQTLWVQQIEPNIPFVDFFYSYSITPMSDNSVVIAGYDNTQRVYAVKVSGDGVVLWSLALGYGSNVVPAAVSADGSTYLTDYTGGIAHLHKIASDGTESWSVDLAALLGQNNAQVQCVQETPDNGCIVTGTFGAAPGQTSFLMRINPDGTKAWDNILWSQGLIQIYDGEILPGGGFVFAGGKGTNIVLIKIDDNGVIYPNSAAGRLVIDADGDCSADAGETGLAGWIVKITAGGQDYYATTDATGHFILSSLPGGASYTVEVSTTSPNYLWQLCPTLTAVMPDNVVGYTLPVDFAVTKVADCALMTVDAGINFLRRCTSNGNNISIAYCNNGTVTAQNAAVELYLDDVMSYHSSSEPATVNGQTVRFELGDVAAGQCGQINLQVTISCAAQIGQTLCVDAHVFPDSFCVQSPNWSGACIEAAADCELDSIHLLLKNTGSSPTTEALDYIIIDDDVVMWQGQLPAGFPTNGVREVVLPADGSTLRISSEQEPNHPVQGNPSVAVEGCNGWNPGFVNQFSNINGNPFSDIACREVVGSYDPNEKQAFPRGVHAEHFIEPGTPLTYLLHFQNTGTDTAFRVVLRDTLSSLLDPASLRVGASSHAYHWELKGKGELVFTFDPIALPDSNVNQAASNGFVQFSIQMKKNIPLGSVISNRAGIYFDQNEVVLTNTVFHTVDKDFLEIVLNSSENAAQTPALNVYPNPADGRVIIELPGVKQTARLMLTDAFGKVVMNKIMEMGKTELQRGELPAGVYFLKLNTNDGRTVANGKVIWR